MKKWIIVPVFILLTILLEIGFMYIGLPHNTAPETWQGIYRSTVYFSDTERESISVDIQETDVRLVELSFQYTKNDASFLTTAQAELALEETSVLTFRAQTGSELPEDQRGTIYVELLYIDEYTIELKYGDTQEELGNYTPIRLTRSTK